MRRWLPPVSAWYLIEAKLSFVAVVLIGATVAALATPILITAAGLIAEEDMSHSRQNYLKKFSSYEELENFVKGSVGYGDAYYSESILPVPMVPRFGSLTETWTGTKSGLVANSAAQIDSDYSTTNIQVEGVDEADIVKTDGRYIYVISGSKVVIVNAYPAENARILSEIEVSGDPVEIFINGNKLVVLGWAYVKVYDVSDRENPLLTRDISFDGHYFDSRMVESYVYVIINSPTIYYWAEKINLPHISSNGNTKTVSATEIYYFENIHDYSYEFTTIMAINTQEDGEEITSETFLIGVTQNVFVSSNNIYITYTNYWVYPLRDWSSEMSDWETEKTIIHKISIADGTIKYKCWGEVPGHVLNQFSMDEYQEYFRIATTTDWGNGARNHVYVLDEDLNIVGKLEDIAPTERIYSARFLGDRAYLVTFRRVDPLFVLDLSNPHDPKILGELKIPGYSDYLHPYDETHIIGVGKETGVKIALFDVSDPENPREISKYEVGSWGTDSYALRDHKAFLFSRAKNLLVMPIGYYSQQDAYVFGISLEDGIVLKGTITHAKYDEIWPRDSYIYSSYRYYHDYSVKRSLYIDNVLYTISDELVKMNNLEDLSEISEVEL